MQRAASISGETFGNVTALTRLGRKHNTGVWTCRCSCGKEFVCQENNLKSGNTKSCGCVHGIFVSKPLAHATLLVLVNYNTNTGIFTRRVDGKNCKAGATIGFVDQSTGYVRVCVEGQRFYGHILAWFYMTGEKPKKQIDHRDTVRTNNRWHNLRQATQTQQNANRKVNVIGASRFKGLTPLPNGRWRAQIGIDYKRLRLGDFDSEEYAAKVYDSAARKLFGEFARTNFGDQS